MARTSSDKHRLKTWCRKWTLAPWSRAASFLAGCGRQTICYDFPHIPEPATRLQAFDTGRAAKVSDQEIWVFSANLWVGGKLHPTGGPCWKYISFTDIFRDDRKREGGRKGCELRIVGKIYSLARGHRHRHETSDWTGRDTNTALHNPTVGRQHTHSKRLFHIPWTLPYTVLRCTLLWRIREQLALLCRRSGVNMTIFQGLCLAASDLETHSPAVIFTHRGWAGQVLFSLLKIIGAVKWQELNVMSWFS